MKAVEMALASPLLNDNRILGAKHILINISAGNSGVTMDEVGEIIDFIQDEAGSTANVIFGTNTDDTMGDQLCVTLIATGFTTDQEPEERIVVKMDETPANKPQVSEVQANRPVQSTQNIKAEMPKADRDEALLIGDSNRPEFEFKVSIREDESNQGRTEEELDAEESARRNRERMENLKKLSLKIKSPSPVSDLETVPAYRRRNVSLDSVDYSSDSQISRFTLSENVEDKKIEIRPNNSFLHDNVD
jgi:cell division protein FtsZ